MVTAGGPYYAPLAEMDFDEARRDVDEHLWLALARRPQRRPARCGREARCCSWAAPAAGAPAVGLGDHLRRSPPRCPRSTANLALELAPVRVNLIAAGFVDTPLSASLLGDELDARREELRATLPIGRVVGPADVAALAVHLMTNTAAHRRDLRHRRRPAARRRLTRPDSAHHREAVTPCVPTSSPAPRSPTTSCPTTRSIARRLSELQGDDPLILTLARGHYCPKEHQQHLELAAFQPKIAVAYTQIVTIATDEHHTLQEFRASVGAQWTFLSDPGRIVQQDLDIQEYTDPEHDPMIPHTLVLKPGLVVHSIYNGYWFWGRPSVDDLWRDLRAASSEIRPDWDLSRPGLREAWDAGDYAVVPRLGPAGPDVSRGDVMPWFPEFISAVELARVQTRVAGQADPVGQYFSSTERR